MNNSLSVIILFGVLFSSCTGDDTSSKHLSTKVITIEPTDTKIGNFEDIFDNVRFLKLATSDSGLIGRVKNIFVSSEYIFVTDLQGVFIFDQNGKFISKIKRKGRAPEEYLAFTDVFIDTISNVLEVLDNRNQKIINYDFSGLFLGERDVPLIPLSFIKNQQDYFFFTGNQYIPEFPNSLVMATISDEFVVKGQFLPVDRAKSKYLHIQYEYNFYYYKDTIRFFRPLDDTIYSIVNGALQPTYFIDFGNHKIPAKFYDYPYKDIREFYKQLFVKGYAYNISTIHEIEQYMFLTYYIKGRAQQLYYNKKTQQIEQFNSWKVGFLGGKKLTANHLQPYEVYNNNIYSYIEPYDFMSTLDSIKESSAQDNWNRLLASNSGLSEVYRQTKISDNPILVIYNIKEK